jgi:hypothetical protein
VQQSPETILLGTSRSCALTRRLSRVCLKFFLTIRQLETLYQLVELAVDDIGEIIQREADPVIGHSVLGKIVSADLV